MSVILYRVRGRKSQVTKQPTAVEIKANKYVARR